MLEICYFSNDYNSNANITEQQAKDSVTQNNSGSGEEYLHKLTINLPEIINGNFSIILKTNGVSTSIFPTSFTLTLKCANNVKDTLPFNYSDRIKVEEEKTTKTLAAPKDIVISPEEITSDVDFTITWVPGDDTRPLKYDLYLKPIDAEKFCIAKDIENLSWTSSSLESKLAVGTYTLQIIAKSSDGQTACSEEVELLINEPEIIIHVSTSVVNGNMAPLVLPDGTRVSSERNTFSNNSIITLIQRGFDFEESKYLTDSGTIYEIRGIEESDNPIIREITTLEKPITISIPIPDKFINAKALYIGIRHNQEEPWRFTKISNDSTTSSARGAIYGHQVDFNSYELGIEFALFASTVEKPMPYVVIDNMYASVTNDVIVTDNTYRSNINLKIEISGKNIDKLNLSDYVLELTYLSDSQTIKRIAGISGIYTVSERPSGISNKYVHKVVIKDFEFDVGLLNCVLNTENLTVSEFSLNFRVILKVDSKNCEMLPFTQTADLTIKPVDNPIRIMEKVASADGSLYLITPSGYQIKADTGTFSPDAIISVEEENLYSKQLMEHYVNGNYIYRIHAAKSQPQQWEPSVEILSTEKPIYITLPNTIKENNVENYYIGLREIGNEEWNLVQIDDNTSESNAFQLHSSVFCLTTCELGIELTLFAKTSESVEE